MSSILINHVIVVGRNKNYTVDFNPGVNIIYGDSATGKSGILNLINYLLGSKKFKLYPEIEASARYAALDVTLNEDRYTIKRDIFDSSKAIEVYPCAFYQVENFSPVNYLPNFNENAKYPDAGFFSDFLMDALNLSRVMLKEAPTKDDSKQVRLSFRDLFKYCYINQDTLGSEQFLKSDSWSLQAKNKEVFKYIFNALDSNISNLEGQISEKSRERNNLEKVFTTVSQFLRDAQFETQHSLDDEVNSVDEEIRSVSKQLEEFDEQQAQDSDIFTVVKTELENLAIERREIIEDMQELQLKIERFTRLKNDYINDINKYRASIAALQVIGEQEKVIELCPVCDNTLDVNVAKTKFEIAPQEKINSEINTLKRRAKETENIASAARLEWEEFAVKLKQLDESERVALELQRKNTTTSEFQAERDVFSMKLGELNQRRQDLVSKLKIRNKQKSIANATNSLAKSIEILKSQLASLREHTPTMNEILEGLADNLSDYLKFVRIKSPTGISYDDRTFYPRVRDIEYSDITSGGLRTIVGIGYMCALMEEALKREMSYPSFLMIDTVGKYLGKTKEQKYEVTSNPVADLNEAVSDPQKYQNIYEYLIKVAGQYDTSGRVCQFILVDNDVPDYIIEDLKGFIVAHYSSERINGLPVGFIDDAVAYTSSESDMSLIHTEVTHRLIRLLKMVLKLKLGVRKA